jgi:hypothetical protein
LNWPLSLRQGFGIVALCKKKLVQWLGSYALGLGMSTLKHKYKDQIPGKDPLLAQNCVLGS